MKVAISYISTSKAKENLENEVPGWSFKELLLQTQQKWEMLLSKIQIDKNASTEKKKIFYTALYHTMLMPVDKTDENSHWESECRIMMTSMQYGIPTDHPIH